MLKSEDYDTVFSNARRFAQKKFLLLVCKNKYNYSRLGIIIAKKNVKLAVWRNRIKRILRENFRHQEFKQNLDIIFLAKKGVNELSNQEIRDQLNYQWQKINTYYKFP